MTEESMQLLNDHIKGLTKERYQEELEFVAKYIIDEYLKK